MAGGFRVKLELSTERSLLSEKYKLECCIMIVLLFILMAGEQSQVRDIWELRAGNLTESVSVAAGAPLYYNITTSVIQDYSSEHMLSGIDGGDVSLTVPLAALLVSEGKTALAELYWSMEGRELPATRNDLLGALAWFGRYELYPVMALNPEVPTDMQGTMHQDQCGAICALGWMVTRPDGLFHGDDLVSASDIHVLSNYFANVSYEMEFISTNSLELIFLSETVLP